MSLRNTVVLISTAAVAFSADLAVGQGAVLHKSGPVKISANGTRVWAVNPDHDSVTRIEVGPSFYNLSQFALPDTGTHHDPRGLDLTPSGAEVWVAAHDSDRVYVFETVQGTIVDGVLLPFGSGPVSIVISPDGTRALVALHRRGAVAVLDTATRSVVTIIDGMFRRPYGITFTSNPNEAWVSHNLPDGEDSFVSALDLSSNRVKALVPLHFVNPRNTAQVLNDPIPIPEGGYIMLRSHIAQPPGMNQVWLPVQYQNRQNDFLTSDSTVNAAIHKIDLATLEPLQEDRCVLSAVFAHSTTNQLLGDGWNAHISGPADIAFSADGTTAYQVNFSSNDVVVFPTDITRTKPNGANSLTEIPVGDQPIGIVASPTAPRLFVLNYLSRDLTVIDTSTLAQVARLNLTSFTPDPVPANLRLGAKLFNSSADPRLNINGKVSCASCHPDGEGDTHLWEFAQVGAGLRKALSLRAIGLTNGPQVEGRGQFHRAGDRDELADFESTFRLQFMEGTGLIENPNPPLGAPNAGLSPDADAFAAFMMALPPITRSPARAPDGSLTESAVRGADLFRASSGPFATDCASCHIPPNFTDLLFHNVGGLAPVPELQGPPFSTSTLVNAWDTGPYAQIAGRDDSQTLGGVLRAPNARTGVHGDTSALNITQMRDLEAFLASIDGLMAQSGIDAVVDATRPRVVAVRPLSLDHVQVLFSECVDPVTATDPANYTLTDGLRTYLATVAELDSLTGRRVTLRVALQYQGCPVTYTLLPGPVQDRAAVVAGSGSNNALDTADLGNRKTFTLDGSITVTFGDSGDEVFPGVASDASFHSGIASISLANMRVFPTPAIPTKSFVKFDFIPTLAAQCGVSDAASILSADFTAHAHLGDSTMLELRRCLMPWNEPPTDACISCPGAVTRASASHGSVLWHQSGARALGGTGTDPAEYYPTGAFDVAAAVDATVPVAGMNVATAFTSDDIAGAFRFWFANPTLNFGYCINAIGPSFLGTEFRPDESEDGRYSMSLSIAFAIAPQPFEDCNRNGIADDCDFRAGVLHDADEDGIPDECVCTADWNFDGELNSQDFFDFLASFFAGTADYNGDAITNSQDFFDFLDDFFTGCP